MGGQDGKMDRNEFEAIYEKHYDRIFKYAYTLLLNREDAEDVTSETFYAAYGSFDKYDPTKASIATWLTRIAHNRAVDLMRSADRSKRTVTLEDWDPADESGDFSEGVVASDAVMRLYAKLTEQEREFLNLRYVMELKDKEIASLLGIPEKTINKRYQRLLEKCRSFL